MDRKTKKTTKERRKNRIRSKLRGTKSKPRMSVFRSNKHIYVQLINDQEGKTLVSASDFELNKKQLEKTKTEKAFAVGEIIGKKAQKEGIEKAVLDRGPYRYHGRVKALAEGARESGLYL